VQPFADALGLDFDIKTEVTGPSEEEILSRLIPIQHSVVSQLEAKHGRLVARFFELGLGFQTVILAIGPQLISGQFKRAPSAYTHPEGHIASFDEPWEHIQDRSPQLVAEYARIREEVIRSLATGAPPQSITTDELLAFAHELDAHVRSLDASAPAQSVRNNRKIPLRTLFLSANPDMASPLAVDREFNRVREKLQTLGQGLDWRRAMDHWPSVRWDQFPEQILTYKPSIVHFSGHGGVDGSLLLSTYDGNRQLIHPDGLVGLLEGFKDTIKMIILNACYSDQLADKLIQHIDIVVGMMPSVSDAAAIVFAPTLYQQLAFGRSVEQAFVVSRASVMGAHPNEANVPRLHVRNRVDPSAVTFEILPQ
jgi:hypothetical protein